VLHTSAGTRLSTSTTFCTSCMACCIVMSYKKPNQQGLQEANAQLPCKYKYVWT
jgi:hypothetical protein